MITICIILSILSFLQSRVIMRGKWLVEKPVKIPNAWWGHAVVGIVCVVTLNYLFIWPVIEFTPYNVYFYLFVTFLSALPGIYFGSIKNWYRCHVISQHILSTLTTIKASITQ